MADCELQKTVIYKNIFHKYLKCLRGEPEIGKMGGGVQKLQVFVKNLQTPRRQNAILVYCLLALRTSSATSNILI